MDHISPRGFQEHVRSSLLHSGKSFDTDKLNHAENAFNSYLVSSGRKELKREHLSEAIDHITEHPDFKKLSPHQQEAFVSSLHKNLGVTEEATTE